MVSFFYALFLIIVLSIVFASDGRAKRANNAVLSERKTRLDRWWDKINKAPLNSREFHEKMMRDYKFYETMFQECSEVVKSIPGMYDIRIKDCRDSKAENVLEMIYDARTGDVPLVWSRGYITLQTFTDCFTKKPSNDACRAFMDWYQTELQKNGYREAKIIDIYRCGNLIGWRFEDGAYDYEMIKRELFISN